MFRKRIFTVIILTAVLAASFSIGYYAAIRYAKGLEYKNNNNKATAETGSLPSKTLINQSTKIVKRHRYVAGMEYNKEATENPSPDVLGMDKSAAEKYYKEEGYHIIEFTQKQVTISKDINSWPPGCIVVKTTGDVLTIYEVDDSGNLVFKDYTNILVRELPEQDKKDLSKGRIFTNMDNVLELLEEYDS